VACGGCAYYPIRERRDRRNCNETVAQHEKSLYIIITIIYIYILHCVSTTYAFTRCVVAAVVKPMDFVQTIRRRLVWCVMNCKPHAPRPRLRLYNIRFAADTSTYVSYNIEYCQVLVNYVFHDISERLHELISRLFFSSGWRGVCYWYFFDDIDGNIDTLRIGSRNKTKTPYFSSSTLWTHNLHSLAMI